MTRAGGPEELLRAWGASPVPPEDAAAAASRRSRVVAAMAARIRGEEQRRTRSRRRLRLAGALAVAAAALVGVGARFAVRPAGPAPAAAQPDARLLAPFGSVLVGREAGGEIAAAGAELSLATGDRVSTGADGRVAVALRSGAAVEMAPDTRLRLLPVGDPRWQPGGPTPAVDPGGERIGLATGRLDVQVPKLEGGRAFRVQAPDAEVMVRGTRFQVTVRDGQVCGLTAVTVTEGLVVVRHAGGETPLGAGQEWSSPCPEEAVAAPAAASPAAPPPDPAPRDAPAAPGRGGVSARAAAAATASAPPSDAPSSASQLAEQNRVFQLAMAAKRRGDDATAVRVLDELLSRFPASPLAQEARVERMRARRRSGDLAGAADEARRYLGEHGDGFARDEAKDLLRK